jgi:signal transduction histidine kinase
VQSRLDAQPEVPVHQLLRELRAMERAGITQAFLLPPGGTWVNAQGYQVPLPSAPAGTRMISRPEARALGLPTRMAALAVTTLLDGGGRTWSVAVAGTAFRERDRAQHARWRLSLSFLLMGGFLLLLVRWALVLQKRELEHLQAMRNKELDRQKDQALAQASRAATMLTLAAGVAHEISTPLGVISGRTAQLTTRCKEDERAAHGLHAIQEQVEHITQTVRRFLDLARGGGLASEELDPATFLASATAMVAHRFREAGVDLFVDTPRDLPRLRGDSRLLEHVLVNLLLNACDASTPGKWVNLQALAVDGGLRVEVADLGKGIPDILVERVMEPFFTTKPQGKGTGLGLALAQEIVRMHKGTLSFQKADPQGTRVLVWLPGIHGGAQDHA